MNGYLISAGELRAIGLNVPADIPDCATVPRCSVHCKAGDDRPDQAASDANVLAFDIAVTFSAPFKWFEATVVVKS